MMRMMGSSPSDFGNGRLTLAAHVTPHALAFSIDMDSNSSLVMI